MTEYIERNAAVMALTLHDCDSAGAKVAILDLPVADVVPVVHGHWIKPSTNAWDHYCSVCKGPKPYFYGYGALDSAFCPNCGAKIDKEAT